MQAGVQCFNINTEIFDCSSFKGVDKFEPNLRLPNELLSQSMKIRFFLILCKQIK